jgi:hypothetical protein
MGDPIQERVGQGGRMGRMGRMGRIRRKNKRSYIIEMLPVGSRE